MQNYIMFSNSVMDYCNPLFNNSPIDNFSYIEVDNEGGLLILHSNHTLLKEAEEKRLIEPIVKHLVANLYNTGRYHYDINSYDEINTKVKFFLLNNGVSNCFIITKHGVRNGKSVIKFFIFITSKEVGVFVNYLINNFETINSFTKYFEKKIKGLLYAKKKIILPDLCNNIYIPNKPIKPTLLFNDLPETITTKLLTPREIEIIKYYVTEDATAEATAKKLDISRRTVEKHWENIREKIKYVDKTDVKKIFQEQFSEIEIEVEPESQAEAQAV